MSTRSPEFDTLPIDHRVFGALQRSDPRCAEQALESGDGRALWNMKILTALGVSNAWLKGLFQGGN